MVTQRFLQPITAEPASQFATPVSTKPVCGCSDLYWVKRNMASWWLCWECGLCCWSVRTNWHTVVISLACHESLGLASLTAFAMPEVLSSMRLVTS